MKSIKIMPVLLATALLASCRTDIQESSSGTTSSDETPTSEVSSVTPSSEEEVPSSEEQTPSSEEQVPSSEEQTSSPEDTSSKPDDGLIASWDEITEGAKGQLKDYFEVVDENGEHTADECLPIFPVSKSITWTYDPSYNASRGVSVGVIALTGEDSNANKALVGQYNASLLSSGWTKATSDDLSSYEDEYYVFTFGKNAYHKAIADGVEVVLEVVPCADVTDDPEMAPQDENREAATSGILIVIQTLA